ncbi:LysE family translocator [Pseudomonas sp. C11]|uniref:LysE family translocator n=1 Tax=Pseudomonas sp. C11 TaxID=3075550 RepID=UPI002AFE6B48|nr:LysE family transporter [Pseudomonas sp. C11]
MQEMIALAGIVMALGLGAASPGPSFVMVAREAVATSRLNALAAALGMGFGGLLFATAALLGLQALFQAVPLAYLLLKVLGGLYLAYLGYRIFRGAREPLALAVTDETTSRPLRRSFLLGLSTQVSNPKTAIVYASVFASFLPGAVSWTLALGLLLSVFLVEFGWYAVVATLLSASAPRRAYLRSKVWVDRLAGAIMVGLGIRLIAGAARP